MAEEQSNTQVPMQETVGETKDRGMFGFMGNKEEGMQHKPQEENISSELGQKVYVSEEEYKPGYVDKLQRSNSSSSSEEEVEGEGGQKIRKKKENKGLTEEKEEGKEGILEKMKDKLTGEEKNEEHMHSASPPPTPAFAAVEGEDKEKKGMLDKIQDMIPGMHSKTEHDKKDCEKESASH